MGANDDWQWRAKRAQNHRELAQKHRELAHFGAMLQKFAFEWSQFSPQLLCRHRLAKSAVPLGIQTHKRH
jgi:hypothetical protein